MTNTDKKVKINVNNIVRGVMYGSLILTAIIIAFA